MATGSDNLVEFVVTPRFDLFYALHALTNPGRTALEEWKSKTLAAIPRDFERLARRVAPLPIFWPLLADSLRGVPGAISFETMLSTLASLAPQDLKRNVLSGVFHDAATVQALIAQKRSLRQVLNDDTLSGGELLSHFGLRPYSAGSHAASAIMDLLTDPESYRDRLAAVVERFWVSAFKWQWNALEPGFALEASRLKTAHRNRPLTALADELNLPLKTGPTKSELQSTSGAAIRIASVDACFVIPSAFNTRRWWARYESKSQRINLYFPVASAGVSPNDLTADARGAEIHSKRGETAELPRVTPRVDAELVFRALGDTTRYAIASILARTPTTSAELARSLGVSKPTITHHVQALRSAGLITEVEDGASTRLSLDRDVVESLSGAAVSHLFSSTGQLQLATTRKRRH